MPERGEGLMLDLSTHHPPVLQPYFSVVTSIKPPCTRMAFRPSLDSRASRNYEVFEGWQGGGGALGHIYIKPAHKIRAISDHDMLSRPETFNDEDRAIAL